MPSLKVFEHQSIRVGDKILNGKQGEILPLDEKYVKALWALYDEKRRPFFTPIRNGIRFCEWVGVIKVLDLTVEILPKADKSTNFHNKIEQLKWQSILIEMLRVCHSIDTPSVSEASLKLKSNSILDLYIQRFINEVNYLINAGLIKKYRKEEVNSTSLKGKLSLQRHIIKNIVHKERFYVVKTTYDKDHIWHKIIFKAIKVLPLVCNNQYLISQCYQLQLNFPEVKDIKVDASLFDNLVYDRKSEPYKSAIQIAKLLLLNYRPDVSSGANHSIAILFDMNKLWEEYIYRMLQNANEGRFVIHNQKSTSFWSANGKSNRHLRPDIIIELDDKRIVIDTKWKNLYNDVKNVGMDDLRQMFAYHHYFDAAECYLLYPGFNSKSEGNFTKKNHFSYLGEKSCGVIVSEIWKSDEVFSEEQISKVKYLNKIIGSVIFQQLGLESKEKTGKQ